MGREGLRRYTTGIESQQWKHQNILWNLFKVNNKDSRTASFTVEQMQIYLPRVLARKKKLMTFSRNWEIGLVFTKGRHHGWRQEKKI